MNLHRLRYNPCPKINRQYMPKRPASWLFIIESLENGLFSLRRIYGSINLRKLKNDWFFTAHAAHNCLSVWLLLRRSKNGIRSIERWISYLCLLFFFAHTHIKTTERMWSENQRKNDHEGTMCLYPLTSKKSGIEAYNWSKYSGGSFNWKSRFFYRWHLYLLWIHSSHFSPSNKQHNWIETKLCD